jgi:hypothetical protein
MYKKFKMADTLPESKFRAIISAFRSCHDRDSRRKLNAFMKAQRELYAELLYVKDWCLVSLDDDKQRMRSVHAKVIVNIMTTYDADNKDIILPMMIVNI